MRNSKTVEKVTRAKIAVLAVAFIALAGSWTSVAAQPVTIDGSTGILPIATDLVQAFKAKKDSAPVTLGRGFSSTTARRDVADGKLVIGLSSDPVDEAERAAGLQSIESARTAVVFAVNSSVNITGLTSEQVCNIYSGRVKNWKDSPSGPVDQFVTFVKSAEGQKIITALNAVPIK